MLVGEYCTREVIVAGGSTGVIEAARMMREYHVGTIVIVDDSSGANRPVGIVSDRDLVVEVMAVEADTGGFTVGDLCTRDLLVAGVDDDLMSTLDRMRAAGVRRIPVVDGEGVLEGLLAVDDMLPVVGEIMSNLAQLVMREVSVEARVRP